MRYAPCTLQVLSAALMLIPMSIGPAIEYYRRQAGLTQAELAARAGIGQSDVSRIIRGQQDLTVSRLSALANALGVTEAELFNYGDNPDPQRARWQQLYEQLSDDERAAALQILEPRTKYSP